MHERAKGKRNDVMVSSGVIHFQNNSAEISNPHLKPPTRYEYNNNSVSFHPLTAVLRYAGIGCEGWLV